MNIQITLDGKHWRPAILIDYTEQGNALVKLSENSKKSFAVGEGNWALLW